VKIDKGKDRLAIQPNKRVINQAIYMALNT